MKNKNSFFFFFAVFMIRQLPTFFIYVMSLSSKDTTDLNDRSHWAEIIGGPR